MAQAMIQQQQHMRKTSNGINKFTQTQFNEEQI